MREGRARLFETRNEIVLAVQRLWLLTRSNQVRREELLKKLHELESNYHDNVNEWKGSVTQLKRMFTTYEHTTEWLEKKTVRDRKFYKTKYIMRKL